jgi:hypothetical protein
MVHQDQVLMNFQETCLRVLAVPGLGQAQKKAAVAVVIRASQIHYIVTSEHNLEERSKQLAAIVAEHRREQARARRWQYPLKHTALITYAVVWVLWIVVHLIFTRLTTCAV